MANKTSATVEAHRIQASLQRGKACLRCRKRKMRCDGTRPACQQCVRAKKADACEYDDGKGKTRTQILRETVARLEARIHELEDPDYVSPAVTLFDPHGHQRSESSSSSYGSPASASISASHSPFASESTSSPHESWTQLPTVPSPAATPFTPEMYFQEQLPQFQIAFELGPVLLDIFAPHRHQCGLEINVAHLLESLDRPASEQRHPALMNAIYLWACFLSRPDPLCHNEEHFLGQALDAQRDGLRTGDNVLDVIRATCLLSTYFLASGRILEGSYHASAASALAVQCGLHRAVTRDGGYLHPTSPSSTRSSGSASGGSPTSLHVSGVFRPSANDCTEGERILTFWQVYNLDRCWSVVLRKPCVVPDGLDSWSSISCPWPKNLEDYETGSATPSTGFQTVRSFLAGNMSPDGFSTQAMRTKASALLAAANHLSVTLSERMEQSNAYQDEIQSLELTISRFVSTLIPVHQLAGSTMTAEDQYVLIATHTLAQAASIHLYQRFSQSDQMAYDKCGRAAREIVNIVKQVGDSYLDFLDPIVGTCWASAAGVLIRELDSLEASWPPMNTTDLRAEIGTILYAMNSLSARFPIVGISASKFQKRLSES